MNIVPIKDVFFDDEATVAMGGAFDQACSSLRHFAHADSVRELVAKRIIDAVKKKRIIDAVKKGSAIRSASIRKHLASTTCQCLSLA